MAKEKNETWSSECSSGYDCYLVVPPFLKYSAGPLLGPAVLEGAAKARGYKVRTVDVNIEYIHSTEVLSQTNESSLRFYGDHAKPAGNLDTCEHVFWTTIASGIDEESDIERIKNGWYSHAQLDRAVENLSESTIGNFLRSNIASLSKPRLLGVSVMWSGQIIPAAIISGIAKQSWPGTQVVWGGAHVTAIVDEIARDWRFGRFVDGFLPRHCEESFLNLLTSVRGRRFECSGLVIPGRGIPGSNVKSIEPPTHPAFSDLSRYKYPRLTLPIELSAGCAYALCSFCTYPSIEGKYRKFPLESLETLVHLAQKEGASLSIKDSLVTPDRLRMISELINGRVEWSACTKLSSSLNQELLSTIGRNGCRTLEVGLESLNPETQVRINKIQSIELLDQLLEAANLAGISVVINYISGFPWEEPWETEYFLNALKERIKGHNGLIAKVEHNRFNLEILSPMAVDPARYGLEITRRWPWSSILDWKLISHDDSQNELIPSSTSKIRNSLNPMDVSAAIVVEREQSCDGCSELSRIVGA